MTQPIYPIRRILMVICTGLVLALISALTLDQSVSLYFKRPELTSVWLFARNITNAGLSEHYFVLAAVLYIFGKWVRPQFVQVRNWARDLFFALITSGIIVLIVKCCVGRQRPHKSATFDPFVFQPFNIHWDFHSFASGHTQVMFTVATLLATAFPRWKWLFFVTAAFFGFTRVIIHDHFLSDVIGGAVIGYVGATTALYWVARWQTRSSRQSDTAISASI
jgi:membrane-associated phospholipid phosphatase